MECGHLGGMELNKLHTGKGHAEITARLYSDCIWVYCNIGDGKTASPPNNHGKQLPIVFGP